MTSAPAGGGSRWASRRRAREAALRMLYQAELGQLAMPDVVRHRVGADGGDALALDDEGWAYAGRLAEGAWDDRQALDGYIGAAARNWRIERLAVIDRLLLRLAIHELLAQPATPPRVVIDEAIELARAYSGDDAARFVNGVLDGVFRRFKSEGRLQE